MATLLQCLHGGVSKTLARPIAGCDLALRRPPTLRWLGAFVLSEVTARPKCPGAKGRSLFDIRDVDMFVRNMLDKAPVSLEPEAFEELVAEGLTILYDLAWKYEPHRAGYEHEGSFAGFAAVFLSYRLTDAWHRLHPNHVYVSLPDGTRRWEYLPTAGSFDERQVGPDGSQRDVVCFDRTAHPASLESVCV